MKIDLDRLENLHVIFAGADDGISLREKGKPINDNGWYISKDKIFREGKRDPKTGDIDDFKDIGASEFFKEIKGLDLSAFFAMGWTKDEEEFKRFDEWEHLAEYLGISKMVTIGVKVPEIIAKRFKYFSSDESNVSTVLRELIINHLTQKWKDQAESLIYREDL